ncbi:hypothetical protein M422DRAFT_247804 [Sphaerobolus stellatus SS14]|nr:hypothetical protein M422DRAFT_247804 [Sphaerobolus stellatus SS14]
MPSDPSSGTKHTAIHFGAGNIGRGFIGPLLVKANFHVVFADVNTQLIDKINEQASYEVHYLEPRKPKPDHIENFSGVVSGSDQLERDISEEDTKLITTSVGIAVLKHVAPAIAKGLKRRKKEAGQSTINIIACENGQGATDTLKEEVYKHLEVDEDKKWIDEFVGFANCSVDRIVPPFEPEENENPLDVGVESFHEWVVDSNGLKGLSRSTKSLDIPGMKLTSDLPAYVQRKLYTLNCGHATAAYLGFILGLPTIYDAITNTSHIYPVVLGAMRESGAALLKKFPGVFSEQEHEAYIEKTLGRFKNSNVVDDVTRVGRQPLRKLGQNERLIGPMTSCGEYNLPMRNLAMGVAATLMYRNDEDDQAKEIKEKVDKVGIEKAVEDLTGFKKGSKEWEEIINALNVLKGWKEETENQGGKMTA